MIHSTPRRGCSNRPAKPSSGPSSERQHEHAARQEGGDGRRQQRPARGCGRRLARPRTITGSPRRAMRVPARAPGAGTSSPPLGRRSSSSRSRLPDVQAGKNAAATAATGPISSGGQEGGVSMRGGGARRGRSAPGRGRRPATAPPTAPSTAPATPRTSASAEEQTHHLPPASPRARAGTRASAAARRR